ncbi:hypothetical protein [Lewinella sp. W8]|uniref:hypothetical protein n=1 Tax=Lewinella sp. W8 TaxID=2528208 RepID=UPI0010684934|nr:hypothetical protein [Lewinella sp. W8]MTB52328.1 hypothetical protein [Lewinella sp. W8]
MISRLKRSVGRVNWKYFLSEVLLIVIGINVGLWFNNLSENRKHAAEEKLLLRDLKSSLESDRQDVLHNLTLHEGATVAAKRLLQFEGTRRPDSVSMDLVNIWRNSILVEDESAFEALKSFGLQRIRDDSLKREIIRLYTVHYQLVSAISDRHGRIVEQFDEVMNDIFVYEGQQYRMRKPGPESIAQHSYRIKHLENSHYYLAHTYRDQVLTAIDGLLDRLAAMDLPE